MNKQQFIKEEKDCASLMGLTLKEYRQSLKNVKANNNIVNDTKKRKYDNSILDRLGLSKKDLKHREKNFQTLR